MTSALEQSPASIQEKSAALGRSLNDPGWLARLRGDAVAAAQVMAFPDSRRQRPWKYLDVSGLNLDGYAPGIDAASRGSAADLRARYRIGETAGLVVQQNSETILTEAGSNVTVTDFADADAPSLALIQQHLASGVPADRNKFTALHYAYLRAGVLVNVAANVELKQPVRIVRDYQVANQIAAPHTLIVAGANSRVSVVEDFRSSNDDIVALPAVEILPGPGAEVRYTAIHRWGTETQVFAEQRMISSPASAFIGFNFVTSGKVVKGHVQCSLEGRGSSSELFGLTLGDDHQHVDFYTLQDHIGADSRSDLLYKSALMDSSKSVYYGLTRVGLQARNSDANQENRNLLLSDDSKAESDPVLEIMTSEVIRASHGATVGPVDQDQLYYMETRGITPPAAEALLVRAFLGQVFDHIPDTILHEELGDVLDAKLEKH